MASFSELLTGLVLAAVSACPVAAEPKAVVELFTSQGCSPCRKADAHFAKLADREDVVALSLHVDYWNYLGWHDTFASPAHSERQRNYAEAHGTKRVYTPQVIVNGTVEAVGAEPAAIEAAIAEATLPVPVSLAREGGALKIDVGAVPRPGNWRTTVRLVLFTSEASVAIAHGENAGATVTYRNVVKEIRPIGMWDGAPVRIKLPEHEVVRDGIDGCAVIVQEDLGEAPGAILGAAQLKL